MHHKVILIPICRRILQSTDVVKRRLKDITKTSRNDDVTFHVELRRRYDDATTSRVTWNGVVLGMSSIVLTSRAVDRRKGRRPTKPTNSCFRRQGNVEFSGRSVVSYSRLQKFFVTQLRPYLKIFLFLILTERQHHHCDYRIRLQLN